MNDLNPFGLIEREVVQEQTRIGRATLWHRVKEGKFPAPFAGSTARACWPQLQITDYLYQIARHGDWSKQRADDAFDRTYAKLISNSASSTAGYDIHQS